MAKKTTAAPKRTEMSPEVVHRVLRDINRAKEDAAEASGRAGSHTQQACESYGVDRKALTLVASLDRKDPPKRLAVYRDLLMLMRNSGHLAQRDFFDSIRAEVADLLEYLDTVEIQDAPGTAEVASALLN